METTYPLTNGDRFTLRKIADQFSSWDFPADTEGRYAFYRRHGLSHTEAMSSVRAWAQNISEQASRRRVAG